MHEPACRRKAYLGDGTGLGIVKQKTVDVYVTLITFLLTQHLDDVLSLTSIFNTDI